MVFWQGKAIVFSLVPIEEPTNKKKWQEYGKEINSNGIIGIGMALEWVWQSSGCYLYMYKIIKEQVKQRTLHFKRVMVLILSKMDSVVQEIMKYFMVCPISS